MSQGMLTVCTFKNKVWTKQEKMDLDHLVYFPKMWVITTSQLFFLFFELLALTEAAI